MHRTRKSSLVRCLPRADAERGGLVHVKPYARVVDAQVRPVAHSLRPVRLSLVGEPIREDLQTTRLGYTRRTMLVRTHGIAGPHLTQVLSAVMVLDEHVTDRHALAHHSSRDWPQATDSQVRAPGVRVVLHERMSGWQVGATRRVCLRTTSDALTSFAIAASTIGM